MRGTLLFIIFILQCAGMAARTTVFHSSHDLYPRRDLDSLTSLGNAYLPQLSSWKGKLTLFFAAL